MDPRRPAVPLELEPDPEHTIIGSDGSTREHYNQIYSDYDAERIRLGYCCIQCGESQVGHSGVTFPENCAVCNFPMREKQRERYAKEWVGSIKLGPSMTNEEELAALAELEERMNPFVEKSSIIIPRGITLN